MRQKTYQLLNVAGVLTVLIVNYFAAAGLINDTDTGAVSDKFPTGITPAGYAFSIWGLIYLGLVAFSIYQALPGKRTDTQLKKIRPLFLINCAANASWLFAWHFELIPLTLLMMLILLVTLILINVHAAPLSGTQDLLLVKAPLHLYFGWVTLATILNTSIFIVFHEVQVSPSIASTAGAILIAAAGVLGVILRFRLRAFLYPMAIAWGVTAIAVKQSGDTVVVTAAAVTVIILLFAALWGAIKDG